MDCGTDIGSINNIDVESKIMNMNDKEQTKPRLAVLGAGESGTGAAILAKQKGYDTFVSDMGEIQPTYKALLNQHGIAWEEGKHTEEIGRAHV